MRKTSLLSAAMILVALPGLARDLTGTVALPPGANPSDSMVLMTDILGPDGMEATLEEPAARSVAVPFRATVRDVPLVLRIGVESGDVLWITDPVHVPAGTADADLGILAASPYRQAMEGTILACGRKVVELGFRNDKAVLRHGQVAVVLPAVPAASGARYSDGPTEVHTKGTLALVTWNGAAFPECAPLPTGTNETLTFRGNEPGFVLVLGPDGAALSRESGETLRAAGRMTGFAEEAVLLWMAGLPDMQIAPGPCRDTMTGMPYPLALTLGDQMGCGGDPATLLAGDWRAVEIEGAALPDAAEVTLSFAEDGIAGTSGCNRYRAGITLSGEGMTVSQVIGTRMACPDMTVEQAFLAALPTVTRFDIGDDGALILIAGDRPVIRARREALRRGN